jgi:hypothetical protein
MAGYYEKSAGFGNLKPFFKLMIGIEFNRP